MEHYRSSSEYREILRILQKSTSDQDNILWQSQSTGKTIVPVQYLEIDFISREVMVNFSSEHHRLDPELPLYVKLDYRGTVFKINNFRQNLNSINFSFPEVIKTQELRGKPRHTFKAAQDKFVKLKSTMSSGAIDGGSELNVRALDISENGLGLIVSEQNRNFLKNNRILWVTGLENMNLPNAVLAEVIYINSEVEPQFQIKKQKSLKVGLKISGIFHSEIYNRFIQ